MKSVGHDTLGTSRTLEVEGRTYHYFSIPEAEKRIGDVSRLPVSLKVLLENLLRTEDGANITAEHVRALAQWDAKADPDTEIQFTPARVIMQDFGAVRVRYPL